LSGYCDSDYAGDIETGKSTSGIVLFHGTNPIYWKSSLQTRVALSTFEAEYYALTEITKNIIHFSQIADELKIENKTPIEINIDNQSAIVVANTPAEKFNAKTKHIYTKYHFIKQEIRNNLIELKHIQSTNNLADILTKPLPSPAFTRLSSQLTGG